MVVVASYEVGGGGTGFVGEDEGVVVVDEVAVVMVDLVVAGEVVGVGWGEEDEVVAEKACFCCCCC